ncbi:MAG: Holliday junction resolvase RuvX [Candidatus Moranbacteria bacterium]|nr:Holliday junction resolvase RuvX [Candidatus Moranbacteria bacterium]
MENKNFLALDWGRSKVGVALAHAETRIAVAYGIWPVDENLWPILKKILQIEEIGTVILGDPEHPEADFAEELMQVREKLAALGVGVVMQNEMFTSKMAQANRLEAAKKAVQAHDDAEAARIMLTDWLEK